MNYETAKKLKELGWDIVLQDNPEKSIVYPTLEQLIEACGENLWVLRQGEKGLWIAMEVEETKKMMKINYKPTLYTGSTPTEAVANLYIKLNENSNKNKNKKNL